MAMMSSFGPADDWWSIQLLNPDMNMISFQTEQEQLAAASSFLGLQDYSLANIADYTCINPLFETYESSENFLLPNFYSPTENINLTSLSPEISPLDEYDCSYQHAQYPKRQKCHDQQIQYCNSNFGMSSYFKGYDQFVQPHLLAPTPSPETQIQQYPTAAAHEYAYCGLSKDVISPAKITKPTATLSAQSIGARERRRRITDKTQELGRLIPGATKMNTAQMLQAAYKYVKFLESQVSVLKLMEDFSIQQENKDLQVVASPIVQEKLYSEEKCLVLKEFVEVLANDRDIHSKPLIKDNVAQLLQINGL